MSDDAEGHVESVRRALDDFLGRLARAVVDGLAYPKEDPPSREEDETPRSVPKSDE